MSDIARYKDPEARKEYLKIYMRGWRKRNSYYKQYFKDKYAKDKQKCFKHYSDKIECNKCHYNRDIRALDLDHINNDGAIHKLQWRAKSSNLYTWLVRNNFPEGFQLLCKNCNWLKWRNFYEQSI